ncbi:MAG: Re/Si-specific NAD(P)(+) transhydrogenase subunit beta, partial [Actinobacteria bacterium]|nr:Re/Si-specific NAD(P)(+) transhydrogenase subunit beta [Actinomycetota bacterium]
MESLLSIAPMLATAAYIVSSLLFILSLAGLSKHESAKGGIVYGVSGMALALVATTLLTITNGWNDPAAQLGLIFIVVGLVIGASIGLWRARVVEMTGMPELIALLHSFVGVAAVLIGWNGALFDTGTPKNLLGVQRAEVFIGVFIGAVTFTGSIVA